MNIQRTNLIIYLAGYYTGRHPNVKAEDLIILIDQHFAKWNNPPMTQEETKYINDLYDEVIITMNRAGLNRNQIRKITK